MRIESSVVDYSVQHSYTEQRRVSDEVRVQARRAEPVRDRAEISSGGAAGGCGPCGEEDDSGGDSRATLAKLIVRVLLKGKFGRDFRVDRGEPREVRAEGRGEQRGRSEAPRGSGPQWSVRVRHRVVYEEKEKLVVGAQGAIQTADGRQFQFDAAFSLSRSFRVESEAAFEAGNGGKAKDPLFLDRGGVSQLLVRDANGDGKLSDLGEVFGATSGDGFGELAALDSDGNGWIDEGDAAFGELRLRLEDGTLVELGALGIGALSTAGAEGEFSYKNDANELVAVVRKTGVYLNENGTAGALRQIDLVM
jgi:hypothetical protein